MVFKSLLASIGACLNNSKYKKAIILLPVAFQLLSCGGGGGDSATPESLLISASKSSALPLENVVFSISGSNNTSDYKIQIDISGSGDFNGSETMTTEALVNGSKLLVSMPMLELLGIEGEQEISIRVIDSNSGDVSNVLSIDINTLSIPGTMTGVPSTVLDMLIKSAYMESGSTYLVNDAISVKPGSLQDSLKLVGQDVSLLDKQAEYILRAAFGVSAIDKGLRTSALKTAHGISINSQSKNLKLVIGDEFITGFETLMQCFIDEFESFDPFDDSRYKSSADAGFDCAVAAVRDEMIPGLGNLQGGIVSVSNRLSSILNLVGVNYSNSYITNMGDSASITHYVAKMAKLGLSMETSSNPQQTLEDYIFGELTTVGKNKLYEAITSNLDPFSKQLLGEIGARGVLDEVSNLGPDVYDALRNLEDSIAGFKIDVDNIVDYPSVYGTDLSDASSGTVITNPFIGEMDLSQYDDPYEICDDPLFQQGLTMLGYTCEEYLAPFLDEEYLNTVIQPAVDNFLANIDIDAFLECVEADPSFTTQFCGNLLNDVAYYGAIFSDIINGYASHEYHCDAGYSEYATNNTDLLTCVHQSIQYAAFTCYSGSRSASEAGLDVGGAPICIYYSRDYLGSNGECRTNYVNTIFQGVETCRWQLLGVLDVAAYQVHRQTGYKSIIIH